MRVNGPPHNGMVCIYMCRLIALPVLFRSICASSKCTGEASFVPGILGLLGIGPFTPAVLYCTQNLLGRRGFSYLHEVASFEDYWVRRIELSIRLRSSRLLRAQINRPVIHNKHSEHRSEDRQMLKNVEKYLKIFGPCGTS
jgi:hypothetical protein